MKRIKVILSAVLITSSVFFTGSATYGLQSGMNRETGVGFSIFTEGGYKNFLIAQETFNALYESSSSIIFGGGFKYSFDNGFYIAAEADFLSKKGERVWVSTSGEYIKTGIVENLNIIPVLGMVGYNFIRNTDLSIYIGIGGGVYFVNVDCEIDTFDRNENGFGFLGVLGTEFYITSEFYISIEGRYESVSGLIGEYGVPALFNEDNLGGIIALVRIGLIL